MKADRWGGQWSQAGVTLRFGDGNADVVIPLSPQHALALKSQIAQAIDEYETRHGTLWSEDSIAIGKFTDAQLLDSRSTSMSPDGSFLYRLVRCLPLQGLERSFKMQAGEIRSDRFLVGMGKSVLPFADLDFIASRMGAPAPFRDALKSRYESARFVHIGFEQGSTESIYKLYLEFPWDVTQAGEPFPLYLGYKWNPRDNTRCAISTYTRPEPLDLPALLKKVEAAYAGASQGIARIAADIIRSAAASVCADALLFVEVSEEGTPRTSFDINLYATGLRLRDVEAMLADARRHCSIDEAAYSSLMECVADDLLGHISGGIDRSGNPFMTTYHKRATVDPAG